MHIPQPAGNTPYPQPNPASSPLPAGSAAPTLAFWRNPRPPPQPELADVCRLAENPEVVRLAHGHKLDVVDVAWEDMSRFANSSVGSNITDATLRVKGYDQRCSILRSPNFTDHTGDFSIGQFQVKVGNETGSPPVATPLRDYLNALLADKGGPTQAISSDREILVAPQACVLPLDDGKCSFNMELFNYQTSAAYPAALAVVCTAEGTSAQVVTERGPQKLFFNRDGRACDFVAERLKHVRQREGRALEGAMNAQEEERNVLLLFQLPLRLPQAQREQLFFNDFLSLDLGGCGSTYAPMPGMASGSAPMAYGAGSSSFFDLAPGSAAPASASGDTGPAPQLTAETLQALMQPVQLMGGPPAGHVWTPRRPAQRGGQRPAAVLQGTDHAQLTVGPPHSSFPAQPAAYELDPDAAIRCTVQHYLVTDTGSLTEGDVANVRQTLDAVYGGATRTGSLVVDPDAASRSTAPKKGRSFWFMR